MKCTNLKCIFVEYFKCMHLGKPNIPQCFHSALIPEATIVLSFLYHEFVLLVIKCHVERFMWYVLFV